ncbi:2-octaprenyl-6-methoxyphenol hydroxylase [Pasteurella canis]|nr:2-octaprenyl-6-methoxyphenol hydroxylase [Pasteurella canis]
MSLVWCVQNPEKLMQCSETEFLIALQHHFGWRLGKLLQCGQRFAYPLNLYQAEQHIQPRIALIGNAAQTLHPIAGQGFNLGIRDVMQLAKLVATNYKTKQDIGDYQNLMPYERARQQDQQQIINLTDSLLSIFANNLLPLQIGRTLGLMALSQSHLLRQYFAKPTLGWK